jgi:DNA-directed RNA polymerase specialized sigma subunit
MSNYKAKEMAMAKYLYFKTSKSQKEIANIVKVTEHAMSRWVRKEKWDEQKKATYYSPD